MISSADPDDESAVPVVEPAKSVIVGPERLIHIVTVHITCLLVEYDMDEAVGHNDTR